MGRLETGRPSSGTQSRRGFPALPGARYFRIGASGLVADGERGLSRLLRRAKAVGRVAATLGLAAFRRRTRSVRRLVRHLHRLVRRKGPAVAGALQPASACRRRVARQRHAPAERVRTALRGEAGRLAQRVGQQFDRVLPLM